MFAQDVSGVSISGDMVESCDSGSDCFSRSMIRESVVSFLDPGMKHRCCVAVLTTVFLSPNIIDAPSMGTPKHLRVLRGSMICSVQVCAAMCSDPKVAISTVFVL